MNKEEIEELKDFTIDLTDIDELALGLEVCSKKSNMVIQEFANLIIELEQQNQKYKEVIDKAIEFTNKNWGTWCTHHLEYMTELQNILKGSDSNEI